MLSLSHCKIYLSEINSFITLLLLFRISMYFLESIFSSKNWSLTVPIDKMLPNIYLFCALYFGLSVYFSWIYLFCFTRIMSVECWFIWKKTLLKLKYLFLFQKASLFCWSISVFLKVMIGLFQVKPYLVKILRIVSWDISISNFLCILSQSFTVDNKGFSNAQSTTKISCSEFSFFFLPEPITLSISPLYLIWSRRHLTLVMINLLANHLQFLC